jgi:xanthine dehydrogenase/oxidase
VQGGALVHVYTDGSVLVAHGGTEMGQGLFTKVIQVAAQCFGIPESFIVTTESATNTVPNASPSAASLSSDLYGMAVLDACEKIRDRLAPMRAKLPDADWPTLVKSAYFERIDLSAHGFYTINTERCGFDFDKKCATNAERGFPFNYFTMGVACTEVEIDCLTGDSYVLRADVLMDVGKSINPAIDIGQIEGAWIQGFGWSTMEELIWGDKEHAWVRPGQLFTRGPGTYKIPSFNDVPADFRVHLSDTDNRFAIHSSKAVGEPPFFMGASALFAIKVRHGLNSSFSWVFMLTLRSFSLLQTGCYQCCASRERLHGVLPAEPAGDL